MEKKNYDETGIPSFSAIDGKFWEKLSYMVLSQWLANAEAASCHW